MALGEIRLRDWWRVIQRELAAGLTLGTILGVIGISRILLWHVTRDLRAALSGRRSGRWYANGLDGSPSDVASWGW